MLRREVENAVIDARRFMSDDPETAMQNLKLMLQNVERAPELSPDVRAQLIDKLQVALREAQHASVIKDELDAAREEELAAARERRLLNDRMARDREKEKQLVDRFNALIGEGRYDDALDVAATISEVDPVGVTPVVALLSTEFRRNDYLMQLTRAARWTNYFDTLYEVERSSVPFPDDPPIVYPSAPVWEELTNRRKDRYGAMDLKATGEAEQRIEKALRSPLLGTGLDITEQPLQDVVNQLQEDYGIPIQLDVPALDAIGVRPDEPVNINLHNVSLRSALRLMLKNLQLTYIVQDEVLMITTPEEAEKTLVVKVYPVADLVLPIDATTLGGPDGRPVWAAVAAVAWAVAAVAWAVVVWAVVVWEAAAVASAAAVAANSACLTTPSKHCEACVQTTATKPANPQSTAAAPKAKAEASRCAAIAIDASRAPMHFWNCLLQPTRLDRGRGPRNRPPTHG